MIATHDHKSSPDKGARLQLLRYIVRLLTNWYEQNGRRLPLPPVRPYLPTFQHALVDLAVTPDTALSTIARLRALLAALKYSRRPDLPEHLGVILADVETLEPRDLFLILAYLDKGPVAVNPERTRQLLRDRIPADVPSLDAWLDRVLDAPDLQAVFAEPLQQSCPG